MPKLYERSEIYDLIENESRRIWIREHYETIFQGKEIHTLLDVSIGSGGMTLPIADLGIRLYGSDLSQDMLDKCQMKADGFHIPITLKCSDFRTVSAQFPQQFDCVISSGNSLGYVPNDDVLLTLEQMDHLIKDGGYLYFDIRNWDMILSKKPRYYLYNPSFLGDTRINLMQFWDYPPDGCVDFNLLYTFEKENRILQHEHFIEHYFPIRQQLLLDKLEQLGYSNVEIYSMPKHRGVFDIETSEWYCVIAKKSGNR